GAGTRLVATAPRQADAVLAVGVLNEPGAVEAVVRAAAPEVRGAERLEGGLDDIRRVAAHRGWRRRRRGHPRRLRRPPRAARGARAPAEPHPEAERRAHALPRRGALSPRRPRAPRSSRR